MLSLPSGFTKIRAAIYFVCIIGYIATLALLARNDGIFVILRE